MSNRSETIRSTFTTCLAGAALAAAILTAQTAQAEITVSGWQENKQDQWLASGKNPGELTVSAYLPDKNYITRAEGLKRVPDILVVLHGCSKQDDAAKQMAIHDGYVSMADARSSASGGYNLLVPGQTLDNNKEGCWNWFLEEDNQRDRGGEADTIWNMVEAFRAQAPWTALGRVYVTGFSAGGAMAAVMAAAYPDRIDGAAVAAGTPYMCGSQTINLPFFGPVDDGGSSAGAGLCMLMGYPGTGGTMTSPGTLGSTQRVDYKIAACGGNAACLDVKAQDRPKILLIQGIPGTNGLVGSGGVTDTVVTYPRQEELLELFADWMGIDLSVGPRPSSASYKHPLTNVRRYPYGPDGGLYYGGRLLKTQITQIGHKFSISQTGCGAVSGTWATSNAANFCAAAEVASFFGL